MEFLAREAMFHACAVRNANRSIQVPLVVKPNGAGVAADSWRRVVYLAELQKPARHLHCFLSECGVPVMPERQPAQVEVPCGWRVSSECQKFPYGKSPR